MKDKWPWMSEKIVNAKIRKMNLEGRWRKLGRLSRILSGCKIFD